MAALLAASQEAHATYLIGLADPLITGSVPGQRAHGQGGPFDVVQLALDLNARIFSSHHSHGLNSATPNFSVVDPADAVVPITVSIGTAVLRVEESDLNGTGSTPSGGGETSGVDGSVVCDGGGRDLAELCGEPVTGGERAGRDGGADMAAGHRRRSERSDATGQDWRRDGDHADADGRGHGGGWWYTVTPTVTVVLSGNFLHQNPDADSLTITGLVVNATDRDGEITTGTVNVTVVDDRPTVEIVAAGADGTPATDSIAEGGV